MSTSVQSDGSGLLCTAYRRKGLLSGSKCLLMWLLFWVHWRRELGATSQPVSWRPLGEANLTLTKQFPLNGENRVAMHLGAASARSGAGITNSGFWGVPVRQGARYELSMYLRHPGSDEASMPSCALKAPHLGAAHLKPLMQMRL